MLKVQEIRELIRLVDQSGIDEFELENDGLKLIMKKNKEVQNLHIPVQDTPVTVSAAAPTPAVQQPASVPVQAEAKQVEVPADENPKSNEENLHKITSPMVGTFYKAPSPGADPYVQKGSKVKKDSIVCIVEAMKLFNEIEADINGEIVEVLVEDGQLVEFGQPLFLVKAE